MKIATLWARIGGALIDLIIVLLISSIILFVWGFLIGMDDSELNLSKHQSELLWIARGTLVGLFVDCVYSVFMMTGSEQATYGQKAVGIKIVNDNGTKISFGTAIGRWVGSVFSSLLLKIGFLIAIFIKNKKTLHDLMAGTIVVESEHSNQKNEKNIETENRLVHEITIKKEDKEIPKRENYTKFNEQIKVNQTVTSVQPITNIQRNINHVNFLKEIANNEATIFRFEGVDFLMMANGRWAIETNSRDYLIFENEEM